MFKFHHSISALEDSTVHCLNGVSCFSFQPQKATASKHDGKPGFVHATRLLAFKPESAPRYYGSSAHAPALLHAYSLCDRGNNNEDVGDPAGDTGRAGGRPPGKQRLLQLQPLLPGVTHLAIVMEVVKFNTKV